MQDVDTESMFKWKSAEKLEKPKITEVIVEERLNATTIVEQAEPVVLPSVPPAPAVDTNSVSEVPISAALPSEQPSVDLDPLAKAQKVEYDEMPPELGDRYEVIEFIGSGGMGSVWKVYDKQLQGTFAVKVLKPELLADETAVKRFEKEANLASDLTHANIAAIFGPGTDSQGRPFIIMGYVDGDSLADILACEGKLSEERALDIFTQVCEALSHSHMKGIIHRDIKPSNIIISKTESGGDMVHIVDFGIARCIYDEVTKTQALTKAVDIFGSPRYMSPEQFLGNSVTGQSDIYSLGCVFYEMLTGAPPFTDENPVKLILQHISETPDLSKVPQRLQLLICECLAKEPELRAPNVDTLLERVAALGSNLFVNGQLTNLIHCIMAVALTLILFTGNLVASTDQPTFVPHVSIAFLLVWLYVVAVNRDNAGRSDNYKILELNLFLATIAGAIVDCLTLTRFPCISLLVVPFLGVFNLFVVLQPSVVAAYSKCLSAVLSKAAYFEPRFYLKHEKIIQRICMVKLQFLLLLVNFTAAVPLFILVLVLCCGVQIASFVSLYSLMLVLSLCIFSNFVTALARLFVDSLTCTGTVGQSLRRSLVLQMAVISIVLLSTLALTNTVGRNGLNQLVRQCFQSHEDRPKEEKLRLEALSYPDTTLANQARLVAASRLLGIDGRNPDALALSQQIIGSSREKDPVTLAAAYYIRFRIRELDDLSEGYRADLLKTISLLESAVPISVNDLESSLFGIVRPLEAEALTLGAGELAVRNKDLVLSKRALKLLILHGKDRPMFLEHFIKHDIWELQEKVEALSAQKLPTSTDHK